MKENDIMLHNVTNVIILIMRESRYSFFPSFIVRRDHNFGMCMGKGFLEKHYTKIGEL